MQSRHDWSQPQRQPASAIFISLHKVILQVFRVIWPFLLIWLFRAKTEENNDRYTFVILGTSILLFIYSVIEFYFLRFSIPEQDLVIRKGVFVKKVLVIPLEKIQAIHIEQNWLHRILNLSQVTFDSPGAKDAEVKIAISRNTAEALRSFILGHTTLDHKPDTPDTPVEQAARTFYYMQPFDLMKLGFSANHLEAFFILLAFGFSLLDDLETATGDQFEGIANWIATQASADSVSAVLVFAIIVLVVSIAASFVRIIMRYANFRLSKTEKGFQVQSGLIGKKEKLIPFEKMQYLSWKANWIRKKINLYLLQFHSIGFTETQRKWEIKVPLTRMNVLPEILKHYHPELPTDAPAIRIHKAYVFRRVLYTGLLSSVILALIAYVYVDLYALWAFILVPYSFLGANLFQRKFRMYIQPEALQVHRAIFGREEILLKWDKVQSVKIRQSIYQRKKQLATVLLYTAGGVINIPFIPIAKANQVKNYALYKVESGQLWN